MFFGILKENLDFKAEFLAMSSGSEMMRNTKMYGQERIPSPRCSLLGFIQSSALTDVMAMPAANTTGMFDRSEIFFC